MRSQVWLLAAGGQFASATWLGQPLEHPGGKAVHLAPRATGASTPDGANGWTPKPTEGPSLELARRRQDWIRAKRQSSNSWLNDKTCGWRADIESEPWTCEPSHTCVTNTDKVVGCSSEGGEEPFFTVCLDYQAVLAGACNSEVGEKTGCCAESTIGECITYLWPGATVKSMYMCHTERAVVTLLSAPFTISASSSSGPSSISETAASSVPAEPQNSDTAASSSGGGTNIGAIVGGAVGGVAGLALILGAIAFFMIRSRKKQQLSPGTGYSAVAPGDPGYPGGGGAATGYPPSSVSPQMSQAGYYSPGAAGSTLQPGTPYLDPHAPPPVPGAYDPRQSSYYDPSKAGVSPHSAYGPYPVSELDSTTPAPGHHSNPVEMASNPVEAPKPVEMAANPVHAELRGD